MRELKRKPAVCYLAAVILVLAVLFPAARVLADATDELLEFSITVDVNEDASLEMQYHIVWKVLDDSIGKLEWIDLGVPNRHHANLRPESTTIDHIEDKGSSLAIYLDRPYGENETVSVDFSMTQDHMYQIDKWVEGETVYTFTPAWFDEMDVDDLTIRWNADSAGAWQPDCQEEDGYLTFRTSLAAGERYTMTVVYPNDTFGFSADRQQDDADGGGEDQRGPSDAGDWLLILLGLVMIVFMIFLPVFILCKFIQWISRGLGFGSRQETKQKIVRTKIEYYDNCPGCGAAREEGKDSCPYCGRSMIKSKEVVEEDQIREPEKYTKKGTYRYGNSGNTYIRVNVVNVPVPHSRPSSTRHRPGGSSHHSSCASTCALSCPCASSCACACACASSGRAGCSVKDFFKEDVHKIRVRIHQ